MNYKFSRKAGNSKIEISKNEQIISKIHLHFFYFTAEILLKRNFKQIKKKNFWQNDLVVFGNENDQPIGEIIFHNWPSRKIIILKDKGKFIMKCIDFWNNKWMIENELGGKILIQKTQTFWNIEGEIFAKNIEETTADQLACIGTFLLFQKKIKWPFF